jgi:formylglycine-generating enzyme required for sulfatase activity
MLIALKTKLALKAALLAAPLAAGCYGAARPLPDPVETIRVEPGVFAYRMAGDFAQAGRPVNAPVRSVRVSSALMVMKAQVSAGDYAACVADGACAPRPAGAPAASGLPVTGVSWEDATAYAGWLTARTGQTWRLPTDAEWAWFAGTRFHDDAVRSDDGQDGFARRWLAKYDEESWRKPATDKSPRPVGSFGENERGIADLSGNVWEWTDTCFLRQALGVGGEPTSPRTTNCGVRVLEGDHRAYVTNFIRDARAGGCAVGIPPANLGFRLVREERSGVRLLMEQVRSHLPAWGKARAAGRI